MTRNLKLILILSTIGVILLLLLMGGHHAYMAAQSKKELLINKSMVALNEAITIERKQYTNIKFIQYNASSSSNSITAQEKQEWLEQEVLTQEDPYRHRLDSLLQVKLVEQDIHIWTGIQCNRNGEVKTSYPEKEIQQANLLKTYKYCSGKGHITLQIFVKIPNRMLINWGQIYMLICIALLGIGILIWIILQKEEKQPVISRKNKPSPKANTVELIVPAENKTITQWKQLFSDVLYEENHHIVKRGTLEVPLQGDKVIYFEALCEAPNHKLTYEELAVIVQERHGEIPKSVEKASRLEKDKFRHIIKELGIKLKPIGIQILNERGKGYQMIFPDDKEE